MKKSYEEEFPILSKETNGKKIAYLDNAATTQKPISVLQAVESYYKEHNANPHRGAYALSMEATDIYENARETVRAFINAKETKEIIFTKSATEGLNLLAYSYGMPFINEGDEILISIAEHHSNLVLWQQVAKAKGAVLKYLYLDSDGRIPETEFEEKLSERTKIVAVAQVSNVLGSIQPIKQIAEKAHEKGAIFIADMAQSVAHMPVDVQDLGVDFAVFSGHKMFAPMGIGVFYGKEELLEKMPPFHFGGDMIEYVSEQEATFAELPQKFEGGTQNVGGAAGLAAAIQYIQQIGFEEIMRIEEELTEYALEKMQEIPYMEILGGKTKEQHAGVISFNIGGVHPHDVATILDTENVAVRSGHHCAHPLMKYYKVNATCRASVCFYNTKEEIDRLVESLKSVRRWMHLES